MAEDDNLMRGFLYMKGLLARYGTQRTAELLTLADRLVKEQVFPNRLAAIAGIEEYMGLPVTTPVSKEVADYTTGQKP